MDRANGGLSTTAQMASEEHVFRSPGYTGEYRKPRCSLFDYIRSEVTKKCVEDPHFSCIIDGSSGRSIRVGDVLPSTAKVVSGLRKAGFKNRDVLCLVTENRCEVYYAILATFASGGILSSFPPYVSTGEMESYFKSVTPKVVICCQQSEQTIFNLKASSMLPGVAVYSLDDSLLFPTFSTLLQDDGDQFSLEVEVDYVRDAILYMPSSGTSGVPKVVQHSNYSLTVGFENFSRFDSRPSMTTLMLNSYYHFTALLFSFLQIPHNTLVMLSELPYTAESMLNCVQQYQVFCHTHCLDKSFITLRIPALIFINNSKTLRSLLVYERKT